MDETDNLKALKRRIYRAKRTLVQKVRWFYNDYRVWLTQLVAMYIIGSDEYILGEYYIIIDVLL